jgi:DNA-binding NarL/FixJ family response regulator
MIKVAIVDDHQLFSEGLASALNAVPDIVITAVFENGAEFLESFSIDSIDVLILDLEMPERSGFDVLREVGNEIRTIIVSMHTGEQERMMAVDLGARAFLSKATALGDVAAAVRAVNDGQDLIVSTPTLRGILDEHLDAVLDPGAASLTHRERELLALIAQGITNTDELANELYISQKTVKNHLASIYDKLAISNRAQAAIEAIRLGFG